MQNEFGEEVPEQVVAKGRELGCIKCPRYIYRDGQYKDDYPAASIGGKKASRFKNMASVNLNKVRLCDGWVAFTSPSHSGNLIKGSHPSSTVSRSSAIIGGFDGAGGLWRSLEEHRSCLCSQELRRAWDEILATCLSFEDRGLQVFSRRNGLSCIIAGLKVMELKCEPPGMQLTLIKNIHNPGKRSVKQQKYRYGIRTSGTHINTGNIRAHLKEQSETIGQLRDANMIGYMEKWLHNLLIDGFRHRSIEGLEMDFLQYEVPLGKVKRRLKFGREHADIFSRDPSGSLVIIEVKETSSDLEDAVRQGLNYLEWVETYKDRLRPRVKELGWGVDLDSLKLCIIAPGAFADFDHIKASTEDEMKDHDVNIVLINTDWYVSKKIEVVNTIKLN